MAARRRRLGKLEFLQAHPACCFYGGRRPTAERAHAPARILFREGHGPEDFDFPACAECNRAAALSAGFKNGGGDVGRAIGDANWPHYVLSPVA